MWILWPLFTPPCSRVLWTSVRFIPRGLIFQRDALVCPLDGTFLFVRMSFSPESSGGKERGDGTDVHPWQRGGSVFLEAGLWCSRRRRAAASSGFPQPLWHRLRGRSAKEVSPSGCPSQLSPPQGLKPNKGCSRRQQIPGNEPGVYRGLPSPTSWRGTQQPLKLTYYEVRSIYPESLYGLLLKHMRYLGSH